MIALVSALLVVLGFVLRVFDRKRRHAEARRAHLAWWNAHREGADVIDIEPALERRKRASSR